MGIILYGSTQLDQRGVVREQGMQGTRLLLEARPHFSAPAADLDRLARIRRAVKRINEMPAIERAGLAAAYIRIAGSGN